MQPNPSEQIDVDTAKRQVANIHASTPDEARQAMKELQALAQKLECTTNPEHKNVMLYSGGLSGQHPEYHNLAGMRSANDLARHFNERYVEKDVNGHQTDGVSIIDSTDRSKFMLSKEFTGKVEAVVKVSMGADGNDPAKLKAEVNKVSLENPDAFWKVASADFVETARGKNLFSAIPEADVKRVFGATELGMVVDTKTANHMNRVPIDELAAIHGREGNDATFDMLKQDSRETLGYMFTKVEVNQENGKIELKPVITQEALEHMGYSIIKDANTLSGPEVATQGGFQGLKGETGPSALEGVKGMNLLNDRLQAVKNMEPGEAQTPTEFRTQHQRAALEAMGGKTRAPHDFVAPPAKEYERPMTRQDAAEAQQKSQEQNLGKFKTEQGNWQFPREVVASATGNVQPLKSFNGTVEKVDGQHDTVTVKVDAAQSRLKQVDFKLADHPELGSAVKGDKIHCEVKNGKLEPQLMKALGGIAGNALDNARHLNAPNHGGPGLAGAAVDAAAHASVSLGQHRVAAGGGRGGR